MSPGEIDPQTVRRHLLALDEALQVLRKHRGLTVPDLSSDREKRWIGPRFRKIPTRS
jgi:hypothetical protein